jgi:hypothetical protein
MGNYITVALTCPTAFQVRVKSSWLSLVIYQPSTVSTGSILRIVGIVEKWAHTPSPLYITFCSSLSKLDAFSAHSCEKTAQEKVRFNVVYAFICLYSRLILYHELFTYASN